MSHDYAGQLERTDDVTLSWTARIADHTARTDGTPGGPDTRVLGGRQNRQRTIQARPCDQHTCPVISRSAIDAASEVAVELRSSVAGGHPLENRHALSSKKITGLHKPHH